MRIGIDAHKRRCVAQIFNIDDKPGELFSFPTTREGVQSLYQRIPEGSVVVIESSTTGKLLSRMLLDKYEVHMVAPPERKPSIKTDIRDADRIVREDMLGYLRRCYVPSQYVEEMRFQVSQMIQTGKKISRVKNQIHSLLERNMVHDLDELSDSFGKEGLERLSGIELPSEEMDALKRYLSELNLHASNHKELEVKLARFAENDSDVKLLMSIPGLNTFTSVAVKSRIGDDVSRFPTKKHLCSYAGVVPRANNSGEYISSHNHVKRGDMILKYALTCSVRGAVSANKNTTIKRHYTRMKAKTNNAQKAEVAAARKLACIVWGILKCKKPYVEEDRYLTAKKMRRAKYLAAEAKT